MILPFSLLYAVLFFFFVCVLFMADWFASWPTALHNDLALRRCFLMVFWPVMAECA
jgi:hypothetical protein